MRKVEDLKKKPDIHCLVSVTPTTGRTKKSGRIYSPTLSALQFTRNSATTQGALGLRGDAKMHSNTADSAAIYLQAFRTILLQN